MKKIALAVGLVLAGPTWGQNDGGIFTLYRNSVLDGSMRVHIATFDAREGRHYNAANCAIAADLFQEQDSVKTRFWCEPGRFRE